MSKQIIQTGFKPADITRLYKGWKLFCPTDEYINHCEGREQSIRFIDFLNQVYYVKNLGARPLIKGIPETQDEFEKHCQEAGIVLEKK